MKVSNPQVTPRSAGYGAVVLLALILGLLFWRSFLPDYVHFSNDGPLGQQHTASAQLPSAFLGTWNDNNDIGGGAGTWPLSVGSMFRWIVGPIGYAKFLAPFALFILGLGAWSFFRALKLTPLAVTLGTLAAVLNSTFFAIACWGVAPQEIAIGMDFFALALVVSISAETPLLHRLARLALAGLCVGMNVMEAADIGAIFSLFVSGFIVFNALNQENSPLPARLGRGIWQTAIVAVFAGFIATQTVVSLVGTQIQGVAGTSQDSETKLEHWDWATQWSLPKVETLGLFMPGLFGYKMDTPNNMDPNFLPDYIGGNYWGGMGRDPKIDRFFDSGATGNPPPGYARQTGNQNYAGVLVVLIAIWGAAQALRKRDSIFSQTQQRQVWFWSGVAVLAVLFAWGRFSMFYALLYQLPYFSTIRSPSKFIIVFSWAIVILFAHGIDGLNRRALAATTKGSPGPLAQLKLWWATASSFDRKWTFGCLAAVVASLLGWLIFLGEKPAFIKYLQRIPGDQLIQMADVVATFSIHQAGWFVVLLTVAVALTLLVVSGVLGGRRLPVAGVLLGLFLLVDMGRANLPYIIHWNYKQKYDIDDQHPGQSINPVLNFLKDKNYEKRVAQLPFGGPEGTEMFEQLYTIEWMQHQFPYYNIQSLDNWQRPRVGSDIATYESAVYSRTMQGLARQWQLTSTRYLIGAAGFLDALNSQIDPVQQRFRIAQRFNIVPKPGVTQPTKLEELTAVLDDNGPYALFEFTGALPRAKLYSRWLVNTNDEATLKALVRPDFDPAQTVLISTPEPGLPAMGTNDNTGTVEYKTYAPTEITFAATTTNPAVMLLNDKFDPGWSATVDGQPAPVLRCNFIMRGVFMSPGTHTVEFRYRMPTGPMYVTLAGISAAILLAGFLLVSGKKSMATGG